MSSTPMRSGHGAKTVMAPLLAFAVAIAGLGLASETAIAGIPRIVPSIAAATVPEYRTSSPMFGP